MLIQSQTDERPDFFALTVHQKYGPALGASVPRGELQNNVQQFGEVQRGIKTFGGLDNSGKLDDRMAPLAAFERYFRVTPEQVHPSAGFGIDGSLNVRLEHSQGIGAAAQHPRGVFTIYIRIFTVQDSGDADRIGGRQFAAFLPQHRRSVHHAPKPRPFQPPGFSQHAHHLSSEFAGFDFRIEGRHHLFQCFERQPSTILRSCFPFHPALPLYSITRMVMSSDCAAPSQKARIPSRIASPSCVPVVPVKSSRI